MSITGVRADTAVPGFLPLQRSSASGFSETLRAQIRAEVTGALSDELSGGGSASATGRSAALQQALLSHGSGITTTGPWADLAKSIGGQYLPPQLADVFSRQMALESGDFDPDVIYGRRVSSAGAEGIAQLMPSSYPHVNRLDPVASLHAAASTMRANLQQFGGDIARALAAYNAGAGTVQNAIARGGADWQRVLPEETQAYLAALLRGAHG